MVSKKSVLGVVAGMLLAAGTFEVADAATHVQKSNAIQQYSSSSLRTVNNSKVKFVKANPNYPGSGSTIKSVSGTKWTLKQKYLLQGNWGKDNTNPQAAAFAGKYLFVLYAPHSLKGKGYIIRYNKSVLDKNKPENFIGLSAKKAGVKVGGYFTVGHGQSLAYDKKTNSLWMWRDSVNMAPTKWSTIQRISKSSLKPDKAIKFYMNNRGAKVPAGHNLTFDTSGHAYWWTISGGKVKVYRGKISGNKIKVVLTKQMFAHQTGTHQQAMGYNPHNGRLYLVSDDSIASFPAKKTYGRGSLTNGSFKYTKFRSHREFESLIFDKSGHGMLLTNRQPQLMRSTTAY
ncbi:hypothetical protein [Lentilactobacillus sp. Marseille-Q4993]|uniref:hypothetical protein n=1 Tax=Lentilactobacillus sp. Marseille-Q4993 TaxID=3039492 RepID=UPI0024BD1B49|nr:hypothetical protein [Lentilactobacillus sp. Marseille-Q4993]